MEGAAGEQGRWRPTFSRKASSRWGSGVASRGRPAPAHTLGPPKVSARPPHWSRRALPTPSVKPHDLRRRRTQPIPCSSCLFPPGGGGSAAPTHSQWPRGDRDTLTLLTAPRAGEALLTPRSCSGRGGNRRAAARGCLRGGRVAAGCAVSRPARLRGDEESTFEAGLPCSRQRRRGVPRPGAWGALCCRRMDWSLSARREQ